jgi:hypothetical protein
MRRSSKYRHRLCACWGGAVLGLLVLAWGAPRQAFGETIKEYAGLSAGLQKTYQIIEKEKNDEDFTSSRRDKVLLQKKIDGKYVFPIKRTFESIYGKYSYLEYMLLSSDRLEEVAQKYPGENELYKMNKIILKTPLDTGVTWMTGDYKKVVESNNETIQVTAGTFANCLKIRTNRKIDGEMVYEETAWYAPGVGEVKVIIAYPLEHKQIIIQLISVKISR